VGILAIVAWFVVLGAAFFFLVVRPQRRQMAAHRSMVAAVEVGDEIITTGGIHGTIRTLHEGTVDLEIANGVVITLSRGAIGALQRDLVAGTDDGEAV
jgi:preprotein translocase subunit YajC